MSLTLIKGIMGCWVYHMQNLHVYSVRNFHNQTLGLHHACFWMQWRKYQRVHVLAK